MDKQISVLVIEDEKHVRVAVGYNLKLERFEVYLAENGLDGIKLAQKKKPKVILLDWMIPEMDGLQVLSELKGNKKTKDIPVFMLTAKNKLKDLDRSFYLGADAYIIKPFKAEELGATILIKLGELERVKVG